MLFIQHAAGAGGSAVSLQYTATALSNRGWQVGVALVVPDDQQKDRLERTGAWTAAAQRIGLFRHTTGGWTRLGDPGSWWRAVQDLARAAGTRGAIATLVEEFKPDVVHLNSVVLLPAAEALKRLQVPFVWHARESPVRGYLGMRTRLMGYALREWPRESIFLSESERRLWGCSDVGQVLPNFVPKCRARHLERGSGRSRFGLEEDAFVLAYLGGTTAIKGGEILVRAMGRLARKGVPVRCLMPGGEARPAASTSSRIARTVLPLLGGGTPGQRLDQVIRAEHVSNYCLRYPFVEDVRPFLEACDVLVFPATANHFARPIVEASLGGRPVVASRLPTLMEMIEDGETGLLFDVGDVAGLANALERLWRDERLREQLAGAARSRAVERYDEERYVERLTAIYAKCTRQGG